MIWAWDMKYSFISQHAFKTNSKMECRPTQTHYYVHFIKSYPIIKKTMRTSHIFAIIIISLFFLLMNDIINKYVLLTYV